MSVTIKEIARITGFSPATVSLVLNNKPFRIAPATRKKILETAKELGYVKPQIRASLGQSSATNIGMLIPNVNSNIYSLIASGVEQACNENGWGLVIESTNNDARLQKSYLYSLQPGLVGGVIITGHFDALVKDGIKQVQRQGLPCLTVGSQPTTNNAVAFDNVQGGYLATKHLLSMGHRKIACLIGDSHLQVVADRLKGYRKALDEFGVAYDPKLIFESDFTYRHTFPLVPTLPIDQFTALFAFSDLMAFACYNYWRSQGIRIPDDISLIGYDATNAGYLTTPPLTSVDQQAKQTGYTAGNILIEQTQTGQPLSKPVIIEPKLLIRQSVKPVDHH